VATIGQLLDRLEIQIRELTWTPEDTVGAHAAGWMPLARATGQAITLLPLGGRSDQVKAGIRNVLAPLAHGPRKPTEDAAPAPQLLDLATTVGAISDSLAGILHFGPRPEQVGRPALELEADLLSAVHVAARWSRTAVEMECMAPSRPPLVTFLLDLIVVTEPYALVTPQRRAGMLESLAFTAPSSPGLEGAVAGWAATAGSILHDRYRVSGWAMQVIAADLALVSQTVRRPFVLANAGGRVEAAASYVSEALKSATRSWRQAAAWPPHVRLGGQNADLRLASRDLREIVGRSPVSATDQARRVLALAVPVGAAQAHCMNNLVSQHELWIHAPSLVPRVPYEPGWIREPIWSSEGRPLLLAAETGHESLNRALVAIGVAAPRYEFRGERPHWTPTAAVDVRSADPVGATGEVARLDASPQV
jgi:hypothetical protein